MSNVRVLALLPFLVKGALSIEIFRAMPERGLDVTVAFCNDTSALYPVDEMEDFRANDRLIDLSKESLPSAFDVIVKAISERSIELIVQVGATPLYHHLARWKEVYRSLRIADILYNEFGHTLNHFLYERCIDGVVVESEAMRDFVRRASFKGAPPVEIVHSGVDLAWFTPRVEQKPLDSALTLGYVGRMSSEKNPMAFVDLAERLLLTDPDLEFRMFGGGPLAESLRERLAQSPARERLIYGGFVEHSRTALHALDVLVLPSKFDGRPVIIMEANGCGVPVVAAPVGGVPEIIEDGVNGFLAHPDQTDAIRALIANWKAKPQMLDELKRSSRTYAIEKFDRRRMFDDYARAFAKIASS